MKITILNGSPDADFKSFDSYLGKLTGHVQSAGHSVTNLVLRDMEIKYCVGCFGCWVKTPGQCVTKDDSAIVCREFINSDLVLFASPVRMGFVTALLKKANEKLIPLLHPYYEVVENECHHLSRYDKYPLLGLLLEKSPNTDDEDIRIISDIYRRDALNFKTRLCFTRLTGDPVEEVSNEINRI